MVPIEKLRKAYYAAAKIVQKMGDDYLIFFERIHGELMDAEKKQDLKTVALDIAKGSCSSFISSIYYRQET